MGHPSVHPTGTTVYKPEKCYNGYTIYSAKDHGAVLVDMNGNAVHVWKDLHGFPNKLLPGGQVFGSLGVRDPLYGYQDQLDLVQVDWDGNIVWKFDKLEYIEDEGEKPQWMARQHHDFQREGNTVGYYVPGMECKLDSGNTLILCHHDVVNKRISDKKLVDDCFIEVDWEGNIVWRWNCIEHFNELGFDETAKNALYRSPNVKVTGQGNWMHINSMSVLGPNKWYDAGDERFHPDNIIWDGRETNICAIISKETGKIVWQVGPDYTQTEALRKLGVIIGQHHCHMIPKGLPGEGNILVYDNGGWGGYGAPSQTSVKGQKTAIRDYSRVIEFNPVTLEVVWEFNAGKLGHVMPIQANWFYSPFVSSAQRLPNGNTLITEGSEGRLLEVTPEYEIVWEYINPYLHEQQYVYRAYRYPYDYVPQLPKPKEVVIEPVDNNTFRLPGAGEYGFKEVVTVEGTIGYGKRGDMCIDEDKPEAK